MLMDANVKEYIAQLDETSKLALKLKLRSFFLSYSDMWQFWINSNFKPTEVIPYFGTPTQKLASSWFPCHWLLDYCRK